MADAAKPAAGHTPCSHLVPLGDGDEAVEGRFDIGQSEQAGLASLLGVVSLEAMRFVYRLEPLSNSRFALSGKLSAKLTQLCVVTLDPVEQTIEEEVSVECWPEGQIETLLTPEAEVEIASLDEEAPVPIINNSVDIGALAAEILALAIDPYPRKQDAAFDWVPRQAGETSDAHPFAKLAKLKSKL